MDVCSQNTKGWTCSSDGGDKVKIGYRILVRKLPKKWPFGRKPRGRRKFNI
jgi:hypothetical protein